MNSKISHENNNFSVKDSVHTPGITAAEKKTITPLLLQSLRIGNHEAFRTVYIHYSGPLCRFLTALCRSRETAEEITQDVFLKLWEKRENINPEKNIRTYLYTMAKNAMMNHFQHQSVEWRFLQSGAGLNESDPASDEILIAQETEILIELAVSRMPKKRREVFELSRKAGMTNEMIAKELNLSKETVAAHLSYARKDIKEVLALLVAFFTLI